MQDFYLKFVSKEEADSVLHRVNTFINHIQEPANQVEESTAPPLLEYVPKYANIDVLGTITRQTGEVDAEGNPLLVPLDGWHVNVRVVPGEDESALLPYAVIPTQPVRIWW